MLAPEISLGGKTVIAVEIACVGDQKTERLDHCIALFEVKGLVRKCLFGKKLSLCTELPDIVQGLLNLLLRDTLPGKNMQKFPSDLLIAFLSGALVDQADRLICERVRDMDAAAVDIEDNVVSIEFILMNIIVFLLCDQSHSVHPREYAQ